MSHQFLKTEVGKIKKIAPKIESTQKSAEHEKIPPVRSGSAHRLIFSPPIRRSSIEARGRHTARRGCLLIHYWRPNCALVSLFRTHLKLGRSQIRQRTLDGESWACNRKLRICWRFSCLTTHVSAPIFELWIDSYVYDEACIGDRYNWRYRRYDKSSISCCAVILFLSTLWDDSVNVHG